MHVVSKKRLKAFWEAHPDAESALRHWYRIVKDATWKTPNEVAQTFNTVDPVKVESGNTVMVFNVTKNKYRLVVIFHYHKARVFVLRVMTHAEYDKDKWKEEL